MKQVSENPIPRTSKRQEQLEQENHFTLKSWIMKKITQYIDSTLQTLFTAAILGGVLWLLQHLWGLRLVPFNVLDAILLVVGVTIVLLIAICILLWWIFKKYPIIFILLGIIALLAHWTKNPDALKRFATSGFHWNIDLRERNSSQNASPSGADNPTQS